MNFKIGFLPISIFDVLDILIVGYMIYQIYKILRGNIAINIFLGVVLLYLSYWLVRQLNMQLLTAVIGQFVSVGVIILIIIFQPEIRRFLLFLGNNTLKQRFNFVNKFVKNNFRDTESSLAQIKAIKQAILSMSKHKVGALIVLNPNLNLDSLVTQGTTLNAVLSRELLETIFQKKSPLHDGAIVIANGKIQLAGGVLPVSQNAFLPKNLGLRHRAAIGLSEKADVSIFVVSEENATISFIKNGKISTKLTSHQIDKYLLEFYRP